MMKLRRRHPLLLLTEQNGENALVTTKSRRPYRLRNLRLFKA
jgi:hypothetical protein